METISNCCGKRADKYEAMAISDLEWLAPHVETILVDAKRWVSRYRCTRCGQIWEERYRSAGQGQVSDVTKIESRDAV